MIGLSANADSPLNVCLLTKRAGKILAVLGICAASLGYSQVFTVQREHVAGAANFVQLQPTAVTLSQTHLTFRTREELIRTFQSDEGFAVRPLPLGKKGLTLHANGPLDPGGNGYVDELEKYGISCKPGDRVIISKFDIKPDRILFEFNGGPEKHHSILQHISVGAGNADRPLAQDNGEVPVGARFVLVFDKFVPELTGPQLRALIAPILDFTMKTPAEAFADTLPPKLKSAILNHEVLVGMNRDMVLKAVGQPGQKVRETENQIPFEEWIYGEPPHEVQFVRFNGNRVIRVEVADVGKPMVVRDQDETDGYFEGQFVHQVRMGDAPPADPNQEHGPRAAPTLKAPGEKLPDVVDPDHQMKPVQSPKDDKDDAEPAPIPGPPGQGTDNQLPGQDEPSPAPDAPSKH